MQHHSRRLDSWKEIATYLGVSERTARRYEEAEGLPVHRLMHEKRGTVYAFVSELEDWRQSRTLRPATSPIAAPPSPAPAAKPRKWLVAAAGLGLLLLAGYLIWMELRPDGSGGPMSRMDVTLGL